MSQPIKSSIPTPSFFAFSCFLFCFSHRRLGWAHSLGNVTIRAKYGKTYDLQITTLQVQGPMGWGRGQPSSL